MAASEPLGGTAPAMPWLSGVVLDAAPTAAGMHRAASAAASMAMRQQIAFAARFSSRFIKRP